MDSSSDMRSPPTCGSPEPRRGNPVAVCNPLLRDGLGAARGANPDAQLREIEDLAQKLGFGIDEMHEIAALPDARRRWRRLEPLTGRIAHVATVAAEFASVEIGGQPAKARCMAAVRRGERPEGGVEVGRCRHRHAQGRVGIVDPPGLRFSGQPNDMVIPENGFGGRGRRALLPDCDRAPGVRDENDTGSFESAQCSAAAMPNILFAVKGPIVGGGIGHGRKTSRGSRVSARAAYCRIVRETGVRMRRVSFDELDALSGDWDARVAQDAGVDAFCSRSAWQIAFARAFEPDRVLWLDHRDEAMVVLAERANGVLECLENMWGFGTPLIGPGAAELVSPWLLERPRPAVLRGLPATRELLAPLVESLAPSYEFSVLPPTTRFVAPLAEGVEGWLAGRRPSFRRNLRAALRRVDAAGIEFRWSEVNSEETMKTLYATILDVEARSWKGLRGEGAGTGPMEEFYRRLWPLLVQRGQLGVLLAERNGVAVGYLHGGRVGDHFRGLQFSFDQAHANVGLGNALQFRALGHLAQAGVRSYDLGGFSDYKGRWGDEGLQTMGLVLRPRNAAGTLD